MPSRIPADGQPSAWQRAPRALLLAAGAVVILVVFYAVVCGVIANVSLTPHRKLPEHTPADMGIVAEAVQFQSAVDRLPLAGWVLPSWGQRAILLLHGLDSHSWDGSHPVLAQAYVEAGFHVLVFDLRGHGRSGGERLGLGWRERRDVRAAVDLILKRGFEPGQIGLHGTSYGAATALLAAAAIPEVGAVVADSAFADVRELMVAEIARRTDLPTQLASLLMPGVAFVTQWLYALDFDTVAPERTVSSIAPRPVLFIHGSADAVIPVAHAYRLQAAAQNAAAELWILPGVGHTKGMSKMRETFLKRVVTFFDQSL